nr:McbB family protein [Pseudomonas veronii]
MMNITIPNYEILNFETESLIISDMGVSKVHSQPLLKALRQLKLSSVMTKDDVDEVLSENGLEANSAFEFLKGIIPFGAVEELYFEKTVVVHSLGRKGFFEDVFRQEFSGALEFKEFSSDVVESVRGGRCFVVLICYGYEYNSIKKLHFDLAKASPQSAISVCWPMGGFFLYRTAIYCRNRKPLPFLHR